MTEQMQPQGVSCPHQRLEMWSASFVRHRDLPSMEWPCLLIMACTSLADDLHPCEDPEGPDISTVELGQRSLKLPK